MSIKTFIFWLLLVSHGVAFSQELRGLQTHYYESVVLHHVYKERFAKFFRYKCGLHNEKCDEGLFRKLYNDIKPPKDAELLALYEARMEKITIAQPRWERIERYLLAYQTLFDRSQFVTLVDLSMQQMMIVLWYAPHGSFYLIGTDLISSGNIEREIDVKRGEDHYFKTPTGIFEIKSGWRSEGKTLEDKMTLPYGSKNRFIFYFGKQPSVRYHTFDAKGEKLLDRFAWQMIDDHLSFALHAHLSQNGMGDPYSHGCIRMTNEQNLFMDNHLVLHGNFYDGTTWISRSANPPKYPRFYEWAGKYLFVVDGF